MNTNPSPANDSLHLLLNLQGLGGDNTAQIDDLRHDLLADGFTYAAVRALSEYFASIIAQTVNRSDQAGSATSSKQRHQAAMTGKQRPAALESADQETIGSALDWQMPLPVALTARERDVIRLLDKGLSDSAIAATLVVSRRTVNSHLRSIYSKFNVGSRTAAVHVARKAGYL